MATATPQRRRTQCRATHRRSGGASFARLLRRRGPPARERRRAMNAQVEIVPSLVDRIKKSLVGLKMPRAIEILDVTLRRVEQGERTAHEGKEAAAAGGRG